MVDFALLSPQQIRRSDDWREGWIVISHRGFHICINLSLPLVLSFIALISILSSIYLYKSVLTDTRNRVWNQFNRSDETGANRQLRRVEKQTDSLDSTRRRLGFALMARLWLIMIFSTIGSRRPDVVCGRLLASFVRSTIVRWKDEASLDEIKEAG